MNGKFILMHKIRNDKATRRLAKGVTANLFSRRGRGGRKIHFSLIQGKNVTNAQTSDLDNRTNLVGLAY